MTNSGASERPPLFEWQEALALAAVRKLLSPQQLGIAMFVALSSSGTSGERATVDAKRLAIETGLSERQVWRHWRTLVDLGWFEQTAKPARPTADQEGRRARYRLTLPALNVSHVLTSQPVTESSEETSHAATDEPPTSDAFAVQHLSLPDLPSDIAEREVGTVLPSDGPPSNGPPTNLSPTLTTEHARDSAPGRCPHRFPIVPDSPHACPSCVAEADAALTHHSETA